MVSRPKKIAALVGGGVGVAGVGLAAVLLTTTITGGATVIDVPGTGTPGNGGGVSNDVSVDVSAGAVNGSNLDCSQISVSKDSTALSFSPVLRKPAANGANASTQPVQGGSCTIKVNVKNTGDVAIKVDKAELVVQAKGWDVSGATGLDKAIQPGDSQQLTAVVSATQAAEGGKVTGQLVYTEVSGA